VRVTDHFDSAHYLRGYKGKCENLHGHRWRIEVCFSCRQLDELGLGLDFSDAKNMVAEAVQGLDHVCLNEVAPFDEINPSTENIARVIFESVEGKLPSGDVILKWVKVWESPDACARYCPGQVDFSV